MNIITNCRLGLITMLALLLLTIPRSAAAQAGNAEEGHKLFDQTCSKCHGVDGKANTPIGKAVGAKDLHSAEALKLTDAEIRTQIEQGKGNMPPFGSSLDKAKINDLVAYVHEMRKQPAGAKKP